MSLLDYVVIALYLALMVRLGAWFSRQQCFYL